MSKKISNSFMNAEELEEVLLPLEVAHALSAHTHFVYTHNIESKLFENIGYRQKLTINQTLFNPRDISYIELWAKLTKYDCQAIKREIACDLAKSITADELKDYFHSLWWND